MKARDIYRFIDKNRDDLKYLLFIGLPFGIIIILLNKYLDF